MASRRADLTGGAPELIPGFRRFVDGLLELNIAVTSRCNLNRAVRTRPGRPGAVVCQSGKIRLVCSLPCYTRRKRRGATRQGGVRQKHRGPRRRSTDFGYGRHSELLLDLVYNPIGPTLPPPQAGLESDYKVRLKQDFGIDFNNLLTIANLPINRFRAFSQANRSTGQLPAITGGQLQSGHGRSADVPSPAERRLAGLPV